ncbi:YdcF family protein [Siphonobacter curvatus]|nr:YdcF family protein [Siphonobacter curvatus]
MPITFLAYGLLTAAFSKSARRKQWAIWATLGWLFISTTDVITNELALAWEYAPVTLKADETYDMAVVLTGGITGKKDGKVFFGNSADRILQPLLLYKAGKIKKILISGGSGIVSAQADSTSEGKAAAQLLHLAGIPQSDIILEGTSRNTRENARNTAKLLGQSTPKILLVTSAFHMRRAVACFQKENVQVRPYPTDFFASERQTAWDYLLIPKEYNLFCTYRMMHEIVGYVMYWAMGYLS